MIKAIFFDVDGVLIPNKFLFTDELKKDYGIDVQVMLPFFLGIFHECVIGKADVKEELAHVIQDWGWKGTVDDLMDYWFSKGSKIDEKMIEIVHILSKNGIRCFVATDQEKYRGDHFEKTLGHGQVFEQVFFSAQAGAVKREQMYWDYVFSILNKDASYPILPHETMFIDDDEGKVAAVARYGIPSYLFKDIEQFKIKLKEEQYFDEKVKRSII
ncbi:MAG: HAD-superfamily hydrolase, subfamily IA, variant 3 [Candidatus Uhrbacteria bacterium GW2011_GWF2_41_16]|uniref:HAD-superfamily hydrolase, subfamily IA, variant 3 n=2 Tax=Candidatus Uhriibacteriota TaxID=1752732 RepID=A0A0G0VAN8_9BACT|nr:MAG: HAD-superfamily hydrolase, subfamily IA, variant 3 [Candidatus Uhrbacteria bacterium GW2011_GWC2_41_11]KKR98043.1 MAG: HAD-superfamily hydrolase, subfamily IA, variant 3 [Candidatus Uhrbacteria bacterium GW2011_GWF2_41_16]HBO99686.1 hypothetical protein [Candidatus Uhrbacteria bacterium]